MSSNKKFSSVEPPEHFLDAESSFSRTVRAHSSHRHQSCSRDSASPAHSTNSLAINTKQQDGGSLDERPSRSLKTHLFQITQGECELKRRLSTTSDFDKNIKNVNLEDDYDIYKQLGTGRFGFIRLAVHRESEIKIALKFFPRPQIKQAEFLREYSFSRFLSPHPNIIDTFEGTFHSIIDSAFFFVQEFCPYASLREAVEASNSTGIGESITKEIMLKVLSAIEFMHSEGLVHRNIKAENILIFDNVHFSRVKVTDFGLTRKADTIVKHLEYVTVYHAPELCETVVKEALRVARFVDIWALGITFYYALKGRFPWQKATIMCKPYWEWDQWLKHKLPQLPKQYDAFTEKALKLFKRCLNPKSKDRWTVKDIKKFVEKERLLKAKVISEEPAYFPNYEDENSNTHNNKISDASPTRQKKSTIYKLINTTFNTMAEISEQVVSARDQ